jgi:3-methyladenine DNA glycosylase AlkD
MRSETKSAKRELLDRIASFAKRHDNPKLQSYLGSPYKVLGLSSQQFKEILKRFKQSHPGISISELNEITNSLWAGTVYEEKQLATSLLSSYPKLLDEASWRMVDRWIESAAGWALCDSLGSGPISKMLYADQRRFKDVMNWTRSGNFWRRRISTYAVRDLVFSHSLDKPLKLLNALLYDEEFWVQRAVGTWLRECWKRERSTTERFLMGHVKGLPKVVITVATERAPKQFRDELRRLQ